MAVDYQSPEALAQSIDAYSASLYAIFGLWFWEVATTMSFDLAYIRGKKTFTLAAAAYFITRYLCCIVWILGVRVINVHSESVDCTAWNHAISATAYGASGTASLLLLLRVSALSGMNTFVVGFLTLFYLATWAVILWGIYSSSAVYIALFHICAPLNVKTHHQLNTTMQAVFDAVCLGFMLFYLLRVRHRGSGHLWGFLMRQGVGYCAAITLAYAICLVFLYLDLNDAISQTANSFALLALVLNATHMQRHLVIHYEETRFSSNGVISSGTASGAGISQPRFATPGRTRTAINVDVTTHADRDTDKSDQDHDRRDDLEAEAEDVYSMAKFDRRDPRDHGSREQLGQV